MPTRVDEHMKIMHLRKEHNISFVCANVHPIDCWTPQLGLTVCVDQIYVIE